VGDLPDPLSHPQAYKKCVCFGEHFSCAACFDWRSTETTRDQDINYCTPTAAGGCMQRPERVINHWNNLLIVWSMWNKFWRNVNVFSLSIWLQYLEEQVPLNRCMILTLVFSSRAMGGGKHSVSHGLIGSGWIIQWKAIFECNVVAHTASLDNVANLKRNLHIVLHSHNGIW
jgi:hypothetical protein